jgi:hypothetical protein
MSCRWRPARNRRFTGFAGGGPATIPFQPPWQGRWRARGSYEGSHLSSSSGTGLTYLLVQ